MSVPVNETAPLPRSWPLWHRMQSCVRGCAAAAMQAALENTFLPEMRETAQYISRPGHGILVILPACCWR